MAMTINWPDDEFSTEDRYPWYIKYVKSNMKSEISNAVVLNHDCAHSVKLK